MTLNKDEAPILAVTIHAFPPPYLTEQWKQSTPTNGDMSVLLEATEYTENHSSARFTLLIKELSISFR
jgi:hypothetical protein